MAIVVVGGQSKNVGKTSVVAGLIAAMPEMRWVAFKLSQFERDDYETAEDEYKAVVLEEDTAAAGTDSSRFLAAGAVRSLWIRTRPGNLTDALPRIKKELVRAENAIFESNSILEFLEPDVYLSVVDPTVEDFKESARLYLDRADAVLAPGVLGGPEWKGVSLKLGKGTRVLLTRPPVYVTNEVVEFVAERLRVGHSSSK